MKVNWTLLAKISKTLVQYDLIRAGEKIMAAVSGGLDSVVMLDCLVKLQAELAFELAVCHLDHGFRGQVSAEDAQWVENLAGQYGLACYRQFADVPAWKKQNGQSSQMAARTLRYQFYQEVLQKTGFDKVALAHHLDDQAETVLNNLIRGAGLTGLKGILLQRDCYIRPLLGVTRPQIAEYAQQNHLEHREDASNQQMVYTRNKIRGELMPILRQYNPEITGALGRLARIAAEEDEYLEQQAADWRKALDLTPEQELEKRVVLDGIGLQKLDLIWQRRILRQVYRDLTGGQILAYEQLEKILAWLARPAKSGQESWPGNLLLRRFKGRLEIFYTALPVPEYAYELKVPGRLWIPEIASYLTARILPRSEAGDPKLSSPQTALLDGERVELPLQVRNRREGDCFWPLGLKAPTKLKKFFSGQGIRLEDRNKLPLILSQGEIIWIGGIVPGENYKITERTEKCLELKIEGKI